MALDGTILPVPSPESVLGKVIAMIMCLKTSLTMISYIKLFFTLMIIDIYAFGN